MFLRNRYRVTLPQVGGLFVLFCAISLMGACANPYAHLEEEEHRLREVLQVDPDSYHARFDLAMLLMKTQFETGGKDRGLIRESRQLFEELLQELPDDTTAGIARAATIQLEASLLKSTSPARATTLTRAAVTEMDAFIERHPDNAIARAIRARTYATLSPEWGKQEVAYEDFGIAIDRFELFLGEGSNPPTVDALIHLYEQQNRLGRKLKKTVNNDRLKELRRLHNRN